MSKRATVALRPDPIMEIAAERRWRGPRGAFIQAAIAYGDQAGVEWARRCASLLLGNWDVQMQSNCYSCWRAGLPCGHEVSDDQLTAAHGVPWAAPFVGYDANGRSRE